MLVGRRIAALLPVLLLLCVPALAQEDRGLDKASDGQFTGLLVVTDDLDWYDMFARPEVPQFSGKSHFMPGDWGSLAIIFSNAEAIDGQAEIRCDIEAFDPTGTKQVARDDVCYAGPYRGPNILHPTLVDLRFGITADDPPGPAGFKVTLRDANSDRELALEVGFTQGAKP